MKASISWAIMLAWAGILGFSACDDWRVGMETGDGSVQDGTLGDRDLNHAEPDGQGCLPQEVHGDLITSEGGVNLYFGCNPGEYFLEHFGSQVVNTHEAIDVIKTTYRDDILGIYGMVGVGITRCCPGGAAEERCLSLMHSLHCTPLEDLPGILADIFSGEEDLCFGANVIMVGSPGPRCDQNDPECRPEPMCTVSQTYNNPDCCPVASLYAPEAPRFPVGDPYSNLSSFSTCTHDGECEYGGCFNLCVAYDDPEVFSICECYPSLAEALCGCVEGQCSWFMQH